MIHNYSACNFVSKNFDNLASFHLPDFDWNAPCVDVHSHIVNIVGILKFPLQFDLNVFKLFWNNAIHEPHRIPCVRCPLNFFNVNAVALVYQSGNVVITGFRELSLARKAFHTLALFYHNHFPKFALPLFNFHITNVVATADIKQKINLLLLPAFDNKFKFDPEAFPAAIFFAQDFINAHATVLLYANGKLVVTGAKKLFLAHCIAQFTITNLLHNFGIFVDRFNNFF
jgi:TATA-box binding protein (TBP) (component of TFIID and TFIIIB)